MEVSVVFVERERCVGGVRYVYIYVSCVVVINDSVLYFQGAE